MKIPSLSKTDILRWPDLHADSDTLTCGVLIGYVT